MLVKTPLLAVDAPSLYFRAFHGIPTSAATAPDGTPVNAVRGFLDMLATLVRSRGPGRIVCALDADWRPAWRVALLPSYKTHRLAASGDPGAEQVPDLLLPQVPILVAVLDAIGIPVVGATDYEADDVLGTLASTQPGPVEVASGDRDLFQLIDDAAGVRLLYCGRGVAKLEVFDETQLKARYGVAATAYVDFAVLRGDPSDGLPGVPGIGDKTAARLLDRYHDLAGIERAVSDPASGFAPGVRAKLQAASDYLAVAPRVVRVVRDVPLPELDPVTPRRPAHPDQLLALAQQWNLAGACDRLVNALAGSSAGSTDDESSASARR
ncbi:5'-3' exonuclease [Natronosporangium hydrolyticum]|uniref:5'-3' exonuclease n=1 Tax=Natronosporangium hydrolyticum TaxID=2811111 RepID=A0A895YB27_9ACTN|nr:5'-3' exonuclease [Natronosporangium hydrolyticum]QSB12673.1 5'-3' exonuclease [Natronosporangium hydrolyticum]